MYSLDSHLRILLIEDNTDDEELLRHALEHRSGYKPVIQRVDTEGATLRALEEATFDLVICDFLLPRFSAPRALEIVREKLFDIPFIILSGFEDEETALKMLKIGANDFIYKRNLSRLSFAIRRELMQAGARMKGRIEIERSYIMTVEAWGVALERRDVTTKNHTSRVTDLTLRLARLLRVSGSQFRSIHYGALLHDIGKMGIPDAILLKRDKLDPSEMAIMKMHPGIAFEMLSHIPFLRDSLDIPYSHHEKFDGTGYPRGLSGDRIPFSARLFSVCDVFDAVTNERPYRESWPKDQAIEHLHAEKGKSFDPAVVNKFIELIK